jgi:hypothetical protein
MSDADRPVRSLSRTAERLRALYSLIEGDGATDAERDNARRQVRRLEDEAPEAREAALQLQNIERQAGAAAVRTREAEVEARRRWATLWDGDALPTAEESALAPVQPAAPRPAVPEGPPLPNPAYAANKARAERERAREAAREASQARTRGTVPMTDYGAGHATPGTAWRDDFGGPAEVDRFAPGVGSGYAQNHGVPGARSQPYWMKGWGPAGGGPGRGGTF